MKVIKSNITYTVPNWNFCNSDNLINGGEVSKHTCKFCVTTKDGPRCLLYDQSLSVRDGLISKVRDCCKATAGFESNIAPAPQGPTVDPKELMKHTIQLYTKTVDDLIKQGYPQPMAATVARKYVLGE